MQTAQPPRTELRGSLAVLYECEDREILLEGRRGTSKTTGRLRQVLGFCRKYPGSRHLLCRQTRASMTDSTLVTLERLIGPNHPEVVRMSREQRHAYHLWGSEIVCLGLDEPSKCYGSEWDTVTLDEAIEADFDAWDSFGAVMRHNRMPFQQRCALTNPGPRNHWLNERAARCPDSLRTVETLADYARLDAYNAGPQDSPMRRLVSVFQDNPAYFDVDKWDWTEQGKAYVQGELANLTGYRRDRFFKGIWANAEGAVFGSSFDEDQHVIRPFVIPRSWPCILAEDPGYDHPTAIVLAAVSPTFIMRKGKDGLVRKMHKLYVCGEIVRRNASVQQDAMDIDKELAPRFNIVKELGDPHYMFTATKHSSGRTIADQMRDFGHRFEPAPAANNPADLNAQVEDVRDYLEARDDQGKPMLQVFDTCSYVVAAFQSWLFGRTAKGEIKGKVDTYAEPYKDEMDAVRMIVASGPSFDSAKWGISRS